MAFGAAAADPSDTAALRIPSRTRSRTQSNPAAVVIAAHLATQRTRGDMTQRKRMKWELTRRLYERGYSKEEVLNLFRLIDWMMITANKSDQLSRSN